MKLQINQSGLTHYVKLDKIIYCKAERSYCAIFLDGEKEIFCSKSLSRLSELLNLPNFVRMHNSYLINIRFVERQIRCKENYFVIMNGNVKIPIARSRKNIFHEAMREFTV